MLRCVAWILFDSMYADTGRDSVPPERLLRGLVLQALYGIRSERLLCEQFGHNPRLRGGRLGCTAGLSGWVWRMPPGTTPPARRTTMNTRSKPAGGLVVTVRSTRPPGYAISQTIRKVIETLFGDGKQHGGTIRQVKLRGRDKVSDAFTPAMLAVNLRRLPRLLAAAAIPIPATG